MIYIFIGCILYMAVFFIADRIITLRRLAESQRAWDEYSKGMSPDEKSDRYLDFCEKQKRAKGWKFCYYPRI